MPPTRIGIDARLRHGETGGLESVIAGLAVGLSGLDGEEEYFFLTLAGEDDWLVPHLQGSARTLPVTPRGRDTARARKLVRRTTKFGGRLGRSVAQAAASRADPPRSDGTVERAGVEVMHFVRQTGFLTSIPSIYHPHDLQHRHFPEYFEPWEIRYRDRWYAALCKQASVVAVASSWTRTDVIHEMGLPEHKVEVVPWAPPVSVLQDAAGSQGSDLASLNLPPRFVFFPGQPWPHKNHEGLIRALHFLRSNGTRVPLVLSGARNRRASQVDAVIQRLDMEDQIQWLGFLEASDLRAVYRKAVAVIIPSKFEAASGPLWEAFALGVPAACSNVTSLPAQAGDAALLFDPGRVGEIASTILRLWTDEELRVRLVERGRVQVAPFTWERTARHFRAHYRKLASRPLSTDDRSLLSEAPLL